MRGILDTVFDNVPISRYHGIGSCWWHGVLCFLLAHLLLSCTCTCVSCICQETVNTSKRKEHNIETLPEHFVSEQNYVITSGRNQKLLLYCILLSSDSSLERIRVLAYKLSLLESATETTYSCTTVSHTVLIGQDSASCTVAGTYFPRLHVLVILLCKSTSMCLF